MMQAFRNAAKPIIIVLTGAFLVWFVWDLSGLGSGGGGLLSRTTVGKVNGRSVDVRSFDQRVQNAISEQQQRTSSNLGLDGINQIRDQVWEQTIQEILFQQEYKRHGLSVTADEVAEAIRTIPLPELRQLPELQTNGQFDQEKYQRWLMSSIGQSVIPGLEYQYRDQLLQAKLFRSVVGDVFVSDAALWQRYRDEKEQVKVGLTRIDPAANVSDEAAPVTPAEARSYYDAHRDEFKRLRGAFLSYVTVPRLAIASDSAAALERARAAKAEIEGGAPFEDVARRESADTLSGNQGGDLGEMTRTQVVPEFGTAVFDLPLNTVSDPVKTQFGYHIIEVESRKGDTFHARHILFPIEITGAHRDLLDAQADTLETLAAEKLEPAALDTAARALGIEVHQVGPINQGARVFVPEGGFVPDAGVWAFQAEPSEQSPVIEADNAFYVFRLDSVTAEGIPPFEQVTDLAERKVRLAKKLVKARELGERLKQSAATAAGLAQASKDVGFDYRELGPFARLTSTLPGAVLTGAAFGVPEGQVSNPIEITGSDADAQGGPAVYLIAVLDAIAADSADFAANLPAIRAQALQAARRSRVQSYIAALRESADVTDYRTDIYRTAAQSAQAGATF